MLKAEADNPHQFSLIAPKKGKAELMFIASRPQVEEREGLGLRIFWREQRLKIARKGVLKLSSVQLRIAVSQDLALWGEQRD